VFDSSVRTAESMINSVFQALHCQCGSSKIVPSFDTGNRWIVWPTRTVASVRYAWTRTADPEESTGRSAPGGPAGRAV